MTLGVANLVLAEVVYGMLATRLRDKLHKFGCTANLRHWSACTRQGRLGCLAASVACLLEAI